MSQTGKREWQTSPTDRDRNSCTHASVCVQPLTHRQTHRRPVVHPLTGRWPDSPAAAGCLMFHSEDHISLPDSSSNRRETERQWQREALLPRHRPDTTKHGLTACVSPHHTHTHTYINHSVNVLYLNLYTVTSHIQVASHTYLSLPSHI